MDSRFRKEQSETPYLDAYVRYLKRKPVCFDVPGHKMGHFRTDLSRKLSNLYAETDVNAPYGMDNLANPKTVIEKAERLAAKAFHADEALMCVNGTSGGILSMFLGAFYPGDKVILPRNVHKSVINAMILSGVVPVFVPCDIDEKLGVARGMPVSAVEKAVEENPDAKGLFVINPTYFGVVSDLRRLVEIAHRHGLLVLADEAHGSNFYFSDELPVSAMDAGADLSTLSMHKNSGSLTQSSFLLVKGKRVDFAEVRKAYNMLTSTSPNAILLCSLDAARKEMALKGEKVIHRLLGLGDVARKKINQIPGLSCYGEEYVDPSEDKGDFDIDRTKLVISVTGIGLTGYDVYRMLSAEYAVQVELGEANVILALLGPGTRAGDVERLVESLRDLSRRFYREGKSRTLRLTYGFPEDRMSPRAAYEKKHEVIPLDRNCLGRISAETIMAYPPGIPLVIPGEVLDENVLKSVRFYQREHGTILKDTREGTVKVVVEGA